MSNTQPAPIECTVRDLSDTGARIYLADASPIPSKFTLETPTKVLRIHTDLVWSKRADHGLSFLETVKVCTDPLRAAAA